MTAFPDVDRWSHATTPCCQLSDGFSCLSKQDPRLLSSPPPRPGAAARGDNGRVEEEEEGHSHYPVEGGAEGEVKGAA